MNGESTFPAENPFEEIGNVITENRCALFANEPVSLFSVSVCYNSSLSVTGKHCYVKLPVKFGVLINQRLKTFKKCTYF